MGSVLKAALAAARSLVHPTILAILVIPMLVALGIWVGVAWAYWEVWRSALEHAVVDVAGARWTLHWDLIKIASWIAAVVIMMAVAHIIILTAVLLVMVFAMPTLVRHIARADYPKLEQRRGGTLLGSVWNALVSVSVFVMLWIVTLPLWLLGPLAAPLPLLLSAYLNQRLFRYDALSEHADALEMRRIFDLAQGRLMLMGLITGAIFFVPLINLVAPIFAALAFIHLCLAELQALRGAPREGREDEGRGVRSEG